jgi:hypothetical protein
VRIVFVLLLLALVVVATLLVLDWRQRRRVERATWRPATHSLPEGGLVVTIECLGEHSQEVARLPPGLDADELGSRLADAEAAASARAATLNAGRRAALAARRR